MISIIVPVYNTEKYLSSCLDSLILQSIDKEIIVIDDGSTDNSLLIANEYARKFPFVYVYHQENRGQSAARNVGIQRAKGDFIFFCDSDDYIETNSLRKLVNLCIQNNLDILKTGWETIDQNRNSILNKTNSIMLNQVICSRDYFILSTKKWFNVIPVNGIIRRQHIVENNLSFPEGIQFEDNTFHLKLMLTRTDARVMQIDDCFYKVRIVSNSTTTSVPSPKKIEDQIFNIKLMRDFISSKHFDKSLYEASMKAVSSLAFTMTSYFYRIEKRYRKEIYKNIPRKYLKDSIRYSMNLFQKTKLFMFAYLRFALDFYEFLRKKIKNV